MIQTIIKKMLRKWLKKKVMTHTGAFSPHFNAYFEWIYNAPLREWKDRLWCMRYAEITSQLDKILFMLRE